MNSMHPFLCLMFIVRVQCDIKKGRCSVLLSNGTKDSFCCDDHEEINGICVACDLGFSAVEGYPCFPCAYPTYGKKCGTICSCQIERCDHIDGCVEHQTTNFPSTGVPEKLTILTLETSNKILVSKVLSTTFQLIRRTNDVIEKTTAKPGTTAQDNTAGLLNREIAIYTICAGTFAVTVLLCSAWRHRYKRIYGYYRSHRLPARRRINNFQFPLPELPVHETEGIYETIDESNMIDEQIPLNEISNNIINIESGPPSQDEDYLIPIYHEYLDLNSSEHSKTQRESDSTESNISCIEQNAYLNSYQSMVSTVDVHPYTKLVVSDSALYFENIQKDPSSSHRKCQQQTLILDADMHEYKSVLPRDSAGSQDNLCLDYVEPNPLSKASENVNAFGKLEWNDAGMENKNEKPNNNGGFLSDNNTLQIAHENVVPS